MAFKELSHNREEIVLRHSSLEERELNRGGVDVGHSS